MDLRESSPGIHVCLVHPGVVATDFGQSALHGGADSRKMPFAQSPEEVAGVIDDPRPDVYTRPTFQQQVVGYSPPRTLRMIEAAPPCARPRAQQR